MFNIGDKVRLKRGVTPTYGGGRYGFEDLPLLEKTLRNNNAEVVMAEDDEGDILVLAGGGGVFIDPNCLELVPEETVTPDFKIGDTVRLIPLPNGEKYTLTSVEGTTLESAVNKLTDPQLESFQVRLVHNDGDLSIEGTAGYFIVSSEFVGTAPPELTIEEGDELTELVKKLSNLVLGTDYA